MIRTITNLAAVMKGFSQSRAIEYVYVSETERDPSGGHITHDWGLEKTEAKGCVNSEHKRTEPHVFVPCSQSARQVVE